MMKVLFKEACKAGLHWDMSLPEELNARWDVWRQNVCRCQDITIPRCVIPESKESIQSTELYGFGDSSKYTYGAVVYVRVVPEHKVHTNIIASKRSSALNRTHHLSTKTFVSFGFGKTCPLNTVSICKCGQDNLSLLLVRFDSSFELDNGNF